MDPNSRAALLGRRASGTLTWRGPAGMLFARAALAVVAQAMVAALFLLRGAATPWHDSESWLPVYGTLIDAGCLALLWRLTRREGIGLFALMGAERGRLLRDVSLGLALIPVGLVFIYGGVYAAGWIIYGSLTPPLLLGGLPLPAVLYGVLIWPFVWGLTEQMTYNGYLLPRFRVLPGSTTRAVAVVAFAWALQHAFMPLTFDPEAAVVGHAPLRPTPWSLGFACALGLCAFLPGAWKEMDHVRREGSAIVADAVRGAAGSPSRAGRRATSPS